MKKNIVILGMLMILGMVGMPAYADISDSVKSILNDSSKSLPTLPGDEKLVPLTGFPASVKLSDDLSKKRASVALMLQTANWNQDIDGRVDLIGKILIPAQYDAGKKEFRFDFSKVNMAEMTNSPAEFVRWAVLIKTDSSSEVFVSRYLDLNQVSLKGAPTMTVEQLKGKYIRSIRN